MGPATTCYPDSVGFGACSCNLHVLNGKFTPKEMLPTCADGGSLIIFHAVLIRPLTRTPTRPGWSTPVFHRTRLAWGRGGGGYRGACIQVLETYILAE